MAIQFIGDKFDISNTDVITYMTVDVTAQNNFDYIRSIQGDDKSRYVFIEVLKNQEHYIKDAAQARSIVPILFGKKPNGGHIFNNCKIAYDTTAIEPIYYVVVELTSAITQVPGRGLFSISFFTISTEDNPTTPEKIESFSFSVNIIESTLDLDYIVHDKDLQDDWKTLTEIINESQALKKYAEESQSWAIGEYSDGSRIEGDDDTQSSKYYALQSAEIMNHIDEKASEVETNANIAIDKAAEATDRADDALGYRDSAEQSAREAYDSAIDAGIQATISTNGAEESRSWAIGDYAGQPVEGDPYHEYEREEGYGDLNQSSQYYSAQSKDYYEQIKQMMTQDLASMRVELNPSSPYYGYLIAEVHGSGTYVFSIRDGILYVEQQIN